MTFVRMVEVTVMQVIDVTVVANGRVATTRSVPVSMIGMGRRRAGRHGAIFFPWPRSVDTPVGSSAACSMALRSIGGKCSSARA